MRDTRGRSPAGLRSGYLVPHRRVGGYLDRSFFFMLHKLFRDGLKRLGTHFAPSTYTRFVGFTFGSSGTVFVHFENTVLYSPVNYVPQTIVLWFGRHFSAPILATLFAARLAAGLVWAALASASVALMRRWRWLWALAVLVPTALAQGPSFSSDSAVLGVVAVAAAYALRLRHAGEPLRRSQVARLAALALLLGLLKLPIPLVAFALVAIVWPSLGVGRARALAASAILAPCLAAAAWWNLTINAYFLPYRNTVFGRSLRRHISQHGQIHYILTHLASMPALLWNTLTSGKLIQLSGLVGTDGTRSIDATLATLWIVGFLLIVLTHGERDGPTARTRAALLGVLVVSLLATAFALYITWTGVGASSIDGMQGRYFTPLLLLVIPLLIGGVRLRLRSPAWLLPLSVMVLSGAGALVLFETTAWSYYHQPGWQVLPRVLGTLF